MTDNKPVVRARLEALRLLVKCSRCKGTGIYERNSGAKQIAKKRFESDGSQGGAGRHVSRVI